MTCPDCGAGLNLLTGAGGFAVEQCLAVDARGQALPGAPRVVERRILANVYTCPACEFAHVGPVGAAGDTWAAWARRLERSGVARAVYGLEQSESEAWIVARSREGRLNA